MSTRQRRRLQALVDRATGVDADIAVTDEEEETTSSFFSKTAATGLSRRRQQQQRRREKQRCSITEKEEESAAEKTEKEKERHTVREAIENARKPVSAALPPSLLTATATPALSPVSTSGGRVTAEASAQPVDGVADSKSSSDEWIDDDDDANEVAKGGSSSAAASLRGQAMQSGADKNEQRRRQGDSGNNNDSNDNDEDATGDLSVKAAKEKERRKAEKRRQRQLQQRKKAAEEDAMLDAMLAQHQHDGTTGSDTQVPSAASPSPSPGSDLLGLVMACDVGQLDTRIERIRMFGAEAVEDVGDGRTPHRRADGHVRDTGSVSIFAEHHQHFKFPHSAFATPNRHRWPPYDPLGLYVTVGKTAAVGEEGAELRCSTSSSTPLYRLQCNSNAYTRAEAAREACVARMGGVNDLLECLYLNGTYHLPSLLQCSETLGLMNEDARGGELLDMALYVVGALLRLFHVSGTWEQRQLPFHDGGNRLLHVAMARGVHLALKRGCLQTAWQRARCLLSWDAADPCAMLLLLDYLALRAKRWAWLLEVQHRVLHHPLHALFSVESAETTQRTDDDSNDVLVLRLLHLPGFAFSTALARHLIEREEERARGEGKVSRVLREMRPDQRKFIADMPSSVSMMVNAIHRFPLAAVELVESLGTVETVCKQANLNAAAWAEQVVQRANEVTEAADKGDAEARAVRDVSHLFVVRHVDLWKPAESMGLLQKALSSTTLWDRVATVTTSSPTTEGAARRVLQNSYQGVSEELIMGNTTAPIPADLLQPDYVDVGEVAEALHLSAEELALYENDGLAGLPALLPLEEESLLRLRALYGGGSGEDGNDDDDPLSELSPWMLRMLLRGLRQRLLSDIEEGRIVVEQQNALTLFLRTLLPWNSVEQMSLREVLAQRGIPDPVATRAAQRRREDEAMWEHDADEEAAELFSLASSMVMDEWGEDD